MGLSKSLYISKVYSEYEQMINDQKIGIGDFRQPNMQIFIISQLESLKELTKMHI